MMKTGNRIHELREVAEWTQEQLAVYAGVTRATVARLEQGDEAGLAVVSVGTLRAIAGAMEVSVVDLIPSFANRESRTDRRGARRRA
jgi:transcriptional regulator with XRE-family HTH domain